MAHSEGCCSQKRSQAASAGADAVATRRGAAAAEVSAQTNATSAKERRQPDIVFPAEGKGWKTLLHTECRIQACSRGCPTQDLPAWRFPSRGLEIALILPWSAVTGPRSSSRVAK